LQLHAGGYAPRSPATGRPPPAPSNPGSSIERVRARLSGGKSPAASNSPPLRINFTGVEGWPRDKFIMAEAVADPEGCFSYGCMGKFWASVAEEHAEHALFRKTGLPVTGKSLSTRLGVLLAEGEKLYGDKGSQRLVSGPGSSGVDNEKEQLLLGLIEAKRAVEGKRVAKKKRSADDREKSKNSLQEAVESQGSKDKHGRRTLNPQPSTLNPQP